MFSQRSGSFVFRGMFLFLLFFSVYNYIHYFSNGIKFQDIPGQYLYSGILVSIIPLRCVTAPPPVNAAFAQLMTRGRGEEVSNPANSCIPFEWIGALRWSAASSS
jgi:hypothetical protein